MTPYQTIVDAINTAPTVDSLLSLIDPKTLGFSERVMIEGPASKRFYHLVREMEDEAFLAMARSLKTKAPFWLNSRIYDDFIRYETESRLRFAQLERAIS